MNSPSLQDITTPIRKTAIESSRKPKLLDRLRNALRTHHYSLRTEQSYIHWVKRFIHFHNIHHPAEEFGSTGLAKGWEVGLKPKRVRIFEAPAQEPDYAI